MGGLAAHCCPDLGCHARPPRPLISRWSPFSTPGTLTPPSPEHSSANHRASAAMGTFTRANERHLFLKPPPVACQSQQPLFLGLLSSGQSQHARGRRLFRNLDFYLRDPAFHRVTFLSANVAANPLRVIASLGDFPLPLLESVNDGTKGMIVQPGNCGKMSHFVAFEKLKLLLVFSYPKSWLSEVFQFGTEQI